MARMLDRMLERPEKLSVQVIKKEGRDAECMLADISKAEMCMGGAGRIVYRPRTSHLVWLCQCSVDILL